MKKIKCYYCGKTEKHEFDNSNCCFSCAKLSIKERYNLWRKTTNRAFSDNVKRNNVLDRKYGAGRLVNIIG